jgi:hypothetical protein
MRKTRIPFQSTLNHLKNEHPLQPLTPDTKLPHVFDLNWDCKTVSDLLIWRLERNQNVRQLLAEFGFDVKNWKP